VLVVQPDRDRFVGVVNIPESPLAVLEVTAGGDDARQVGPSQAKAMPDLMRLEHIAGVDASVPEAHQIWHGLRLGGTNLPGVITAGRYLQHGEWAFWDVHDPDKAIAIRLRDEHYAKLVIGVDDPAATAKAIAAAIRPAGG
jgi:hypothetical protein